MHFQWNEEGKLVTVVDLDQSGGGAPALAVANHLAAVLDAALAAFRDSHPELPAFAQPALNPNLIPRLGVTQTAEGLTFWIETLGQNNTPFHTVIDPNDCAAQVIEILEANGGIAPQWQIDTVLAHWQDNGSLADARAGAYDWQHQAIEGNAVESSSTSQHFAGLVLHLPDTSLVLGEAWRDVEGDGFVERTEWLGASPDQALLVLDYDGNGLIDRTGEILNLGGNGNAHAGIQRNNVAWLDADSNGVLDAADPAFAAIRVWIDANGDGVNQSGELNSLAATGIERIDFTTGEVVRSDGSELSLTAHTFDAATEGVRTVDLTPGNALGLVAGAGTVLEHEGYQGQRVVDDGNGARTVGVRNTWIEQDAQRIGDWEGTAEAAAHRHGGGNAEGSPTETRATGAVSVGPATANATTRTTVAAGDARLAGAAVPAATTVQRQIDAATTAAAVRSAGVAFVPLGSGSAQQELREVTAEMIRSGDSGIFSSAGAAPLVGLGVGAAGLATATFPTVASAAVVETVAAASDAPAAVAPAMPLVAGGYVMHADTASAGASGAVAPTYDGAVVLSALAPLAPLAGAAAGGAVATPAATAGDSGASPATAGAGVASAGAGASAMVQTTPAPAAANAPFSAASPTSTPTMAPVPESAASSNPLAITAALDRPVVQDERLAGVEDTELCWTAAQLLANDHSPNAGVSLHISAVGAASHGTVTLGTDAQGNAEIVFVPDLDFHGDAGFEYTVTDGVGLSTTASVSLAVAAVNDAPVTAGEAATTAEDTTLRFAAASLLANDSDVDTVTDGQVLSIARVGQASHGTVTLGQDAQGNAEVRFLPDAEFHGTAGYTYWVSDGAGGETPATVSVDVTAVNDVPVTLNETATTAEDTAIRFVAAALLANDRDADTATDGQVLSIARVGQANHGTVTLGLNADGRPEVTFLPDVDFHGTAGFTYWVSDGAGGETPATVAVNVTASNDAPVMGNETATTAEDTTIRFAAASLLANDSDVDTATDGQVLSIARVGQASHGTVVLGTDAQGNEEISFTPEADFHGTAGFTYWVSDGAGGETAAQATLTVTAVNDAPVAVNDRLTAIEDTELVVDAATLLANDWDVDTVTDGDVLTIVAVSAATHGTVSLAADGRIHYLPDADYNGPAQFDYTVADPSGALATATVSLNATSVNDLPTPRDDLVGTLEDTPLLIAQAQLLANDSDTETPTAQLRIVAVDAAEHGTVTLLPSGSISFVADADFFGTARFRTTVRDGDGGETQAWTNVQVAEVNDAPETAGEAATTAEDTAIVFAAATLLADDRDVDTATVGDVLTISRVGDATHGSVALATVADGSVEVRFTPDADYFGAAQFTYWVADGRGGETPAAMALTVVPVNDAPVAPNVVAAAVEDTARTLSRATLLANATDVDNAWDDLSVVRVVSAQHGQAALDANGGIIFTPDADFHGTASVLYVVADGAGGETAATATLQVAAVNDAPVIRSESASTFEDAAITFAATTLLANDTDADIATDGDVLAISRVGNATHGSVALTTAADGNVEVRFTPDADYFGAAQFTYWVADGHGGETPATMALTITAVNDAPVAPDIASAAVEDTILTLSRTTLLANATDVDNAWADLAVARVVSVQHGQAALDANGGIRFTPDANFHGTASVRYVVADGTGGETVATATLQVAAVNDAPATQGESASTSEDTAITFTAVTLLANDTDADTATDGDAIRISRVAGAQHGTATIDGAGNLIFTPDANYHGSASFNYWVADRAGAETVAGVAITVAAVNDLPVAVGEQLDTQEDTVLLIAPADLLANDRDVDAATDGQVLSITAVANAQHGTVQLVSGLIRFTPDANFNGIARFDYTVADGSGGTATATATISLSAVNDVPVTQGETASGNEDTELLFTSATLLANDRDVDTATNGDALRIARVGGASNGTVSLDAQGIVHFMPTHDYNGAAQFTYYVADRAGVETPATVNLTINPVNDAPVVRSETVDSQEDQVLNFAQSVLLANDRDVDSGSLYISSVGSAANGSVAFNGDGSIRFTPGPNYNGAASFTYTVTDGAGGYASGTVGINIAAVNDAPIAIGESASFDEDTVLHFAPATLLANDHDIDSNHGNLYIAAVSGASGGTVQLNTNDIVFTPWANYNGPASFDYTIADGAGGQSRAMVSLTINPVNDAPVAVNEILAGQEDQAVTFLASALLANDYDIESPTSALTISRVGGASRCTVYQDGSGNVVFIPEANYNGAAQFTYWVRDRSGAETPATVTVNLAAVNDAPTAQGETVYGASEDARFYISPATLLANDSDSDGPAPLHVSWVGNAANGAVWTTWYGTIVFDPAPNFNGTAQFDYRVADGSGAESATVTAYVPVAAVNDVPVAVDDRFQTTWNSQMAINFSQLTGNDSDADGDALTVAALHNAVNGTAWIENGVVRFNPTAGFSGVASFQYLADDGHGGQSWATAAVDVVTPPNLYPTLWTTQIWVTYYDPLYIYSMTSNIGVSDDGDPNAVTVSVIRVQTLTLEGTTLAGYDECGSYYSDYGWVWHDTTPAAIGYSMNLPGGVFYAAPGLVGAIQIDWKVTDDRGLVNYAHLFINDSLPGEIIDTWNFWNDHYGYAPPVVLDLDGDGFSFQSLATSNVHFDVNGDGHVEKLAWAAPEDGVVVWDRNGDGRVTEAAEFSFANPAAGADTDLAGLRAFDTNGNDLLDTGDAQWAAFGVWQDRNGNGVTDDGEYHSLADMGIASLRLQSNGQMRDTGNDAIVLGETVAMRNDGSTLAAADTLLAIAAAPDAAYLARQALLFSQWAAAESVTAEPMGYANVTLADQDIVAQLIAAQLEAAHSATGASA